MYNILEIKMPSWFESLQLSFLILLKNPKGKKPPLLSIREAPNLDCSEEPKLQRSQFPYSEHILEERIIVVISASPVCQVPVLYNIPQTSEYHFAPLTFFFFTLLRKLSKVLNFYVANADDSSKTELLFAALKALKYLFRFIIQSRVLYLR